ncbi:hypothetical protein IC744_16230 [Microbacterium hominis]|uniref:hypothetical protein n=1 Tax=Microbacterium hominis TaxID=162426 RepID=UPI00168A794C|nr:hypothetical protein [Microbacterium hominis]QOC24808.1 hypothetical protein IC745_10475 [Microbacterium hominis]QOC28862.1 hypothetical protein IC744_16230 [Microbacterium hominis]
MSEPEATATPQPMPASRAAATPIPIETEPDARTPLWAVVLVGILGAVVLAEAVLAWAVL